MGGSVPKQFLSLKGKPLLDWSLGTFESCDFVAGVVLVLPEDYLEEESKRLKDDGTHSKLIACVAGGENRQESVSNGLKALPSEANWVAVHDAARPFVTSQLISATFTLARQIGAAIPTVSIHDTLVQVDEYDLLKRPIARNLVKRSQTPQIFTASMLAECHEMAQEDGMEFTDDATLVSHYEHRVATFSHYGENRKITTPADMEKIAMQKSNSASGIRCGQGFDSHRFDESRTMILAGVTFPGEPGLAGHSDADVLTHAVCDALLGASALGDIGQHFPDSDPAYKNISSLVLLEETVKMVRDHGFDIVFIDTTLVGDKPRIASRRDEMREKLASVMGIDPDNISVKATTTEGMTLIGNTEGLAAMATATLEIQGHNQAGTP